MSVPDRPPASAPAPAWAVPPRPGADAWTWSGPDTRVDRAPSHLLYLHGFRSSPASAKARVTAGWVRRHRPDLVWACPQLPPDPAQALAEVEALLARWPAGRFAVIGSSLGGFYATVLAERHGAPSVRLNPAVDPARDLSAHLGPQTAWHDPASSFEFTRAHVGALRAMTPAGLTMNGRALAVIAEGDEVLDWREMSARHEGALIKRIAGSDHALSRYETDHLPDIVRFLRLDPA
jgi:predicted esterase YcpF (UPF0227 family)